MDDLSRFTDAQLHAELGRRRERHDVERMQWLNEHFGPCPECEAPLAEIAQEVVQEHWTARGWKAWPVPPPDDWPGRELVASEVETTLTCQNGHVRRDFEIRTAQDAAAQREP